MKRKPRFATRMMLVQTAVVGVGALTLIATAWIAAPILFHQHLSHLGMVSADVQLHAEEAFAYSLVISVTVATVVSMAAAAVASWFLVRRVSRPIEELAKTAESVAAGNFEVIVPDAGFSSELEQLSNSFTLMAARLGDSEAARSRLLADLAHELRTPLATLEAYIDGLEDDVIVRDSDAWATMRHQVHRLERLAGDLRETAAAEEHALGLKLALVDIRDTCAAAVADATVQYQNLGVSLTLVQSTAVLPVMGDELRLQQVLANLLENALRHSPAGLEVKVLARLDVADVCVEVIDEGAGIPPAEIGRIFDRFHRVDPARVSTGIGGSGLGLTIARAIVNDHGGSLEASSDGLGQGATFTMSLPKYVEGI
ncbi:MAG: HAMP domain-containing sensor histidine kinase [Actinomycetota bacterium]|nr:HAMP domain-containing sensor histidine kinase [Actinomycetota bacterium]